MTQYRAFAIAKTLLTDMKRIALVLDIVDLTRNRCIIYGGMGGRSRPPRLRPTGRWLGCPRAAGRLAHRR